MTIQDGDNCAKGKLTDGWVGLKEEGHNVDATHSGRPRTIVYNMCCG